MSYLILGPALQSFSRGEFVSRCAKACVAGTQGHDCRLHLSVDSVTMGSAQRKGEGVDIWTAAVYLGICHSQHFVCM